MTQNVKEIIVVACRNAAGEPDFFVTSIENMTKSEHERGLHYLQAQEEAAEQGYEGPFICYGNAGGEISRLQEAYQKARLLGETAQEQKARKAYLTSSPRLKPGASRAITGDAHKQRRSKPS